MTQSNLLQLLALDKERITMNGLVGSGLRVGALPTSLRRPAGQAFV